MTTKEQRAQARQRHREEEARVQAEWEAQVAAHAAGNPMRMLELIVLSIEFGVGYAIRMEENTIKLILHADIYPTIFHKNSEEWEMNVAFDYFRNLREAKEERLRLLAIKERVLSGLTEEEKKALKQW